MKSKKKVLGFFIVSFLSNLVGGGHLKKSLGNPDIEQTKMPTPNIYKLFETFMFAINLITETKIHKIKQVCKQKTRYFL